MKAIDIAVNLFRRYEQVREVNNYPGLLAIYALAKIADVTDDQWALGYVKERYLSRYPDKIRHPRYNFESYRAGGLGQAYLLMRGLNPEKEAVIRQYAEETLRAPVDHLGIMCSPYELAKEKIWIDVVMPTTPFMLFAGLHFKEERYIDFGVKQCFMMYDVFEDQENHLLHQGRGFRADVSEISTDHWSRGNGWGLVGVTELVQHLPPDSPHYGEAVARFRKHCAALLPHQTNKGLWRQEIPEPLAWEESSGTGLILSAYGVGLRMGLLEESLFGPAFRKGINGLVKYCIDADFSAERSCPGCLCPGEGEAKGTPQAYLTELTAYRNENHAFAPFMLALLEAHLNGLTTVEWNK